MKMSKIIKDNFKLQKKIKKMNPKVLFVGGFLDVPDSAHV
jgi:hypothetical protein